MNREIRPITGRHVVYSLIAFFGLIFTVNAVFVYFALNSWTGLETREHYTQGLAYNKILDADSRQQALGWRVDVSVEQLGPRTARLIVTLNDRSGAPLTDVDDLQSTFVRPTHEGHDFSTRLTEISAGRYEASIEMPLAGQWDHQLIARRGADRFSQQDRVFLK